MGSLVIAEARGDRVFNRPAVAIPVEVWPRERKADFLLCNSVDSEDCERARDALRRLGLDEAADRGWVAVDMKADWKATFPGR